MSLEELCAALELVRTCERIAAAGDEYAHELTNAIKKRADSTAKAHDDYNARILTLAEELAGFCDVYRVEHPPADRIAAAFHYAELNGMLVIDEIHPFFRDMCSNSAISGTPIPTLLSLLIAGSLSGWDADVALKNLGWTDYPARPDLTIAVIANHPEIMTQAREHELPLTQIWGGGGQLPGEITSYQNALNNVARSFGVDAAVAVENMKRNYYEAGQQFAHLVNAIETTEDKKP